MVLQPDLNLLEEEVKPGGQVEPEPPQVTCGGQTTVKGQRCVLVWTLVRNPS